MNRFTVYTNSENSNSEFISLCQERLNSDKSEVIILKEGIDFNMSDIDVDSLPTLKFSFINSSNNLEYEHICKNLNDSILYLKKLYLI